MYLARKCRCGKCPKAYWDTNNTGRSLFKPKGRTQWSPPLVVNYLSFGVLPANDREVIYKFWHILRKVVLYSRSSQFRNHRGNLKIIPASDWRCPKQDRC